MSLMLQGPALEGIIKAHKGEIPGHHVTDQPLGGVYELNHRISCSCGEWVEGTYMNVLEYMTCHINALVAQGTEQGASTSKVEGSNPSERTNPDNYMEDEIEPWEYMW